MLRHRRKYLDGKPVRVRIVARHEFDVRLEQLRCHENAARQPVEPSYNKESLRTFRVGDGLYKLRPVAQMILAAGLNFGVLADNRASECPREAINDIALRGNTETV